MPTGEKNYRLARLLRVEHLLYTLAVRDIMRVPAERISAHLFFLQAGSDLALSFTGDDLKQEVEAALLAIGRGEFPVATQFPFCGVCDYDHLCNI